jgi:hypothetical protein
MAYCQMEGGGEDVYKATLILLVELRNRLTSKTQK